LAILIRAMTGLRRCRLSETLKQVGRNRETKREGVMDVQSGESEEEKVMGEEIHCR